MTLSEALRQRQIAIEHLRQWSSERAVDDIDYFEAEIAKMDEIVFELWMARA